MAHECSRQLFLFIYVFVCLTYIQLQASGKPLETNSVIGFPPHPKDVFATH